MQSVNGVWLWQAVVEPVTLSFSIFLWQIQFFCNRKSLNILENLLLANEVRSSTDAVVFSAGRNIAV